MFHTNIKVFVLFSYVSFVFGQFQPDFGFPSNTGNSEECIIRDTGQKGVCKKLISCQSAQNDYITKRIHPTNCYFDGFDPVVCCATATSHQEQEKSTILPPVPEKRISLKKCEEKYPEIYFIVLGELTIKDEFPYMAAIGWKRFDNEVDFRCGGFLIAEKFVITAAHCASLGGAQPDVVRIGADNINSDEYPIISIEKIYIHPNYNSKRTYFDIAIIQLTKNSEQKPACLWQTDDLEKYTTGTAIGYGDTQFGGKRSEALLKVELKFYNTEECDSYYKPEPQFPRGLITFQMCAGDPAGAKDTCQGDSGGPLLVKSSFSRPFVVGLTSFGAGCAGATPSIYTRISSYLDWIEAIVWPEQKIDR